MDASLAEAIRVRAGLICEYCRMPQSLYPTVPFPIDHIIARQHGGATSLRNLAFSCLHCNAHKGPNIAGRDRRTRKLHPLFNPRRHKWSRHFRWNGPILVGRTPIGRVTVQVLAMNSAEYIEVREAFIAEGRF